MVKRIHSTAGLHFEVAAGGGLDGTWAAKKAVVLSSPPPSREGRRAGPGARLSPPPSRGNRDARVKLPSCGQGQSSPGGDASPIPSGRSTGPDREPQAAPAAAATWSASGPPAQKPSLNKALSSSAPALQAAHKVPSRPHTAPGCEGGATSLLGATSPLGAGPSADGAEPLDDMPIRTELIRMRKRLHQTACELQRTRDQLELAQRELQQVRADNDELRLKFSSLERTEKTSSAELLEERRKSDELSKQVKAMSQNLLSIIGQQENGGRDMDISGLQKRCFKLVQQNTALTVQTRLLRRQKGWAEAKARVLQDEVTRVYLGQHDQVKSGTELEQAVSKEFSQREVATANGAEYKDGAQICKLLLPVAYKNKEAVIDFLTHVTHTSGNDVHGFLQSSRVFSSGIRNECLSGLGREYYAHVRQIRQLPVVLRAAERIVHLGDYLSAFEGFSRELSELFGCGNAKLWVHDAFRQVLWTCSRVGEEAQMFDLQLPKGSSPEEVAGHGLAVVCCLEQRSISVPDASKDERTHAVADAVSGRLARSVLCVPVCQKGQTKVVLQVMNKLTEPDFDVESDCRVLRLLGRVSMEVLQVCEANSTQSAFTKRKDSLLQLFNDFVPCQTPVQLLHAVETGLRELFHSQAATLHMVQNRSAPVDQQGTALLLVDSTQNRTAGRRRSTIVHKVETKGLRGIVGQAVKTMNNISMSFSQEGSMHDSEVDLAIEDKTVLHTVPLMDSGGCCAVCQFRCPERKRTVVGDDGTFRPDNIQHMRLLTTLLKFVQKHISILDHNPMEALHRGLGLQQTILNPIGVDEDEGMDGDGLTSSSSSSSSSDSDAGDAAKPTGKDGAQDADDADD